VIRFQHVYKEYPRTGLALQDVSLFVGKGEFVFLTGPSGAGKSSLLKLVYMEELPTRGDMWVSGVRAKGVKRRDVAKLRRKLGVVFQDFRLLEDRTAEANIAFALEVIDTPRAAIPAKVSRALAQVGLSAKATSLPSEMSGGEQQRVAIARALVNDPAILLADEPTGNLDSNTSEEIMRVFEGLATQGQTVVMVTHEPDIAAHARRVVVLRDGVIASDERREQFAARIQSQPAH
jgi:cell division transport system ATP-binding protein